MPRIHTRSHAFAALIIQKMTKARMMKFSRIVRISTMPAPPQMCVLRRAVFGAQRAGQHDVLIGEIDRNPGHGVDRGITTRDSEYDLANAAPMMIPTARS